MDFRKIVNKPELEKIEQEDFGIISSKIGYYSPDIEVTGGIKFIRDTISWLSRGYYADTNGRATYNNTFIRTQLVEVNPEGLNTNIKIEVSSSWDNNISTTRYPTVAIYSVWTFDKYGNSMRRYTRSATTGSISTGGNNIQIPLNSNEICVGISLTCYPLSTTVIEPEYCYKVKITNVDTGNSFLCTDLEYNLPTLIGKIDSCSSNGLLSVPTVESIDKYSTSVIVKYYVPLPKGDITLDFTGCIDVNIPSYITKYFEVRSAVFYTYDGDTSDTPGGTYGTDIFTIKQINNDYLGMSIEACLRWSGSISNYDLSVNLPKVYFTNTLHDGNVRSSNLIQADVSLNRLAVRKTLKSCEYVYEDLGVSDSVSIVKNCIIRRIGRKAISYYDKRSVNINDNGYNKKYTIHYTLPGFKPYGKLSCNIGNCSKYGSGYYSDSTGINLDIVAGSEEDFLSTFSLNTNYIVVYYELATEIYESLGEFIEIPIIANTKLSDNNMCCVIPTYKNESYAYGVKMDTVTGNPVTMYKGVLVKPNVRFTSVKQYSIN